MASAQHHHRRHDTDARDHEEPAGETAGGILDPPDDHRADDAGEGGDVGPELAGIGRTKGREYVLRSILFPNAEIAAGFENVVLTLKDGTSVTGVLKSESDTELVVQSPEEGRVTVKKAALDSRERGPSAMIEGLGDLLSPRDLRDIVEVLSE